MLELWAGAPWSSTPLATCTYPRHGQQQHRRSTYVTTWGEFGRLPKSLGVTSLTRPLRPTWAEPQGTLTCGHRSGAASNGKYETTPTHNPSDP
jgi:hypothetical protein